MKRYWCLLLFVSFLMFVSCSGNDKKIGDNSGDEATYSEIPVTKELLEKWSGGSYIQLDDKNGIMIAFKNGYFKEYVYSSNRLKFIITRDPYLTVPSSHLIAL